MALLCPYAWAGSYTLTSQTGGENDNDSSGYQSSYPYSTSNGEYGAVSPEYIADGTTSCTGTITTVYTWQPSYTGEQPPQDMVIAQSCTAAWSGSATEMPSGSADDGLGDAEQTSSSNDNGYYSASGSSSGTHYKVQDGGNTVTITSSPASNCSSTLYMHSSVYYSVNIYPITIDAKGTTLDVSTLKNLTGQQIVATLVGLPSGSTHITYQWSVGGDTFETYNENASSNQLVELTAADKAAAQFNFYDKTAESITISCTATFNAPDGTPLTVTAQSPTITVEKPSTSWDVNDPKYFPITGFFNHPTDQQFGANEGWYPVKITMPTHFTGVGGTGCFAQLVTTDREVFRHPINGKPGTYYLKIPDGSGGWVIPGTGLDLGFPYPKGFILNPDGSVTPVLTDYHWASSDAGFSGDSPKQSYTSSDIDGGGNDWYKSTASDSFTTWVMFKPNSTNAVWVPLQKLIWSWNGTATKDSGGTWTATGSMNTGKGNDTSDAPQWNVIIKDEEYHP